MAEYTVEEVVRYLILQDTKNYRLYSDYDGKPLKVWSHLRSDLTYTIYAMVKTDYQN